MNEADKIAEEHYFRVVESNPGILALDPKKDLRLIIALAFGIGFQDGVDRAQESIDRIWKEWKLEKP